MLASSGTNLKWAFRLKLLAMVAIVILDANFLFVPFTFGIDIFSMIPRVVEERCIMVVPRYVLDEIKKKSYRERRGAFQRDASAALRLLQVKIDAGLVVPLEVDLAGDLHVDDGLVALGGAISRGELPVGAGGRDVLGEKIAGGEITRVIMATNDKLLKKKAVAAGLGIIQVRKRRTLQLVG